MVTLGQKVTDKITGFEGIATGRTEYLYGCVRVCVESQRRKDDGSVLDAWFDEQRLGESAALAGGPAPAPPARDPPSQ